MTFISQLIAGMVLALQQYLGVFAELSDNYGAIFWDGTSLTFIGALLAITMSTGFVYFGFRLVMYLINRATVR